MLTRAAVIALGLLLAPMTAGAVTLHDIVGLSNAGVPDVVLTALIDADRTVFTIDPTQVLELRAAGVSDAVILKMIRSRQEFAPWGPTPEREPQTSTLPIVGPDPFTPVAPPSVITVAVPIYVPVPIVAMHTSYDYTRAVWHRHQSASDRDKDKAAAQDRQPGFSVGLRIRNGEFIR